MEAWQSDVTMASACLKTGRHKLDHELTETRFYTWQLPTQGLWHSVDPVLLVWMDHISAGRKRPLVENCTGSTHISVQTVFAAQSGSDHLEKWHNQWPSCSTYDSHDLQTDTGTPKTAKNGHMTYHLILKNKCWLTEVLVWWQIPVVNLCTSFDLMTSSYRSSIIST